MNAVFAGVKFAGAMRAQPITTNDFSGKFPFAVVAPARHLWRPFGSLLLRLLNHQRSVLILHRLLL